MLYLIDCLSVCSIITVIYLLVFCVLKMYAPTHFFLECIGLYLVYTLFLIMLDICLFMEYIDVDFCIQNVCVDGNFLK